MNVDDAVQSSSVVGRAQGCLLGQIAGDSLGSLVEFESAESIRSRYGEGPSQLLDGGCWGTIAGQPTDDSELALALAHAIVAGGGYDCEKVAIAYAEWLESGPFDVGTTTRTALYPAMVALKTKKKVADAAIAAANENSQANGALMRISSLGIFGVALELGLVMELAREDARLTHPNPVCQDANAVFAATLAFAIRTGANARETYHKALETANSSKVVPAILDRLNAAETAPPDDFMQNMGWVLLAFQNAFYQLLHAATLSDGIVRTVKMGGDTDTNGAIAGALLGAVYGIQEVPKQWIECILACKPIAGLKNVNRPRPSCYWPVDAMALAEQLLHCGAAK